MTRLTDVTNAEWAALRNRRIFFGHRSVGRNIMEGVTDILAAHPEIGLNVVESKSLGGNVAPAFYHAPIGRNRFPAEKSDEFATVAKDMAPGSVGMVKFCYVDVNDDTDPGGLLETYQGSIDRLRAANPAIEIVHITMPVTTDTGTLNHWKGRLRREPNERRLNALRHRYNVLMRQAYEGHEPLFDLAGIEVEHDDGSPFTFRRGSESIPALAPEWTDDGGHLNVPGRRRVAEQFLVFLAKLGGNGRRSS